MVKRSPKLSNAVSRGGRASGPDGARAAVARLARCLAALVALLAPGPVLAHPHIFIDAGLTLLTDGEGRVTSVEVTWRYDELYTLILLQDYGLDPDFDTALTEAEVDATLGFDLNWNSGFEGGLRLFRGEGELALGTPEAVSLTLLPDGRLETVHRRPVTGDPGTDAPVEAQVYDDAFYIAFEAILPSGVAGGGCAPDLVRADLDAAYAALEVEIANIGGVVAAEDNFPAVGALFADRLVFSCVR
jgi:ABC-type uncharacterized transport system substrate-binding protein